MSSDLYHAELAIHHAFRVVESVRKEYLAAASRVSLSASHQALLAFTDNTVGSAARLKWLWSPSRS